ncbi:MAG: hypothetical protein ACK4XJ_06200 [Fimbriimonadaceae bacterium]
MTPRRFCLTLSLVPGIGPTRTLRILTRNHVTGRTPAQFFRLTSEVLQEEYRLPKSVAEVITAQGKSLEERAEELDQRLQALGVSMVALTDAGYPPSVENAHPEAPPLLFLYGNTRLLHAKTFGVFCSNDHRSHTLDWIERLTEAGVLDGEICVSGHDRIEYQRAAVVPLRWGAPRILVLDRGMFEALGPELKEEPFRAARLWRYEFDPRTDLVVSPFAPHHGFIGQNNRMRDFLAAALCRRADFVAVRPGGTMEKVARMMLQADRPIRVADHEELLGSGASALVIDAAWRQPDLGNF